MSVSDQGHPSLHEVASTSHTAPSSSVSPSGREARSPSLLRRLRRHSLRELLALVPVNLHHAVRRLSGRQRRARDADRAFDRTLGLDTSAPLSVGALGTGGAADAHASPYVPVGAPTLRAALAALPVEDFTPFTFIDLGSGKGRALLIAAEFGFREIVGVEYSLVLHEIAVKNMAIAGGTRGQALPILLHHGDAGAYAIPSGDKVIFLFNPFDGEIMARVAANIEAAAGDARTFVIYVNPRNRTPFETAAWETIADDGYAAIYRAREASRMT